MGEFSLFSLCVPKLKQEREYSNAYSRPLGSQYRNLSFAKVGLFFYPANKNRFFYYIFLHFSSISFILPQKDGIFTAFVSIFALLFFILKGGPTTFSWHFVRFRQIFEARRKVKHQRSLRKSKKRDSQQTKTKFMAVLSKRRETIC